VGQQASSHSDQPESQSASASPNQSAENSATTSAKTPPVKQPEQKDVIKEKTTGTSDDRLFWTLPNFLSVKSKDIPPLSAAEKFKVVARGNFDPIELVYVSFLSGISQASDSEPGFGQGAAGYGKRFGSSFADTTIENFMTGAILPSVLKQDPRFYQLGQGSFGHRAEYAISRIFVTRGDSGRAQFNFSEVVGSALAAGISTYSYHPREDRNVPNALSVWGTQVGWDTVTIVVKEFWPDVHRHFAKKRVATASDSQGAPSQ
jgi:hypothetical protein